MATAGRTNTRQNNPIQTNGLGRHPSRVPSLRTVNGRDVPIIGRSGEALTSYGRNPSNRATVFGNEANELSLEISDGSKVNSGATRFSRLDGEVIVTNLVGLAVKNLKLRFADSYELKISTKSGDIGLHNT